MIDLIKLCVKLNFNCSTIEFKVVFEANASLIVFRCLGILTVLMCYRLAGIKCNLRLIVSLSNKNCK